MTGKARARTFESAYRSLESLVNEIESSELGLEEGIAKFEQGLELAQFCKERLTEAENNVIMIKRKFGSFLDKEAPDDDDRDPTGRPGVGDDDEMNDDIKEPGDDEKMPDETEEDEA